MKFTAKQIADVLKGEIIGDENATIETFAKIEEGVPGAISFMANPKYQHYVYSTKSSIVLVNADFEPKEEVSATLIKVSNAYEAVAQLLTIYEQSKARRKGIDKLACIDESAEIGADCYIGPNVYVGKDVQIGNGTQVYAGVVIEEGSEVGSNCLFYPNVSIYHHCEIGDNVILHSGCVIGADGFGFAPAADGYEKIPQIGNVILEDNVEIGANSCVDRSTMGSTIVHKGVKLDNLVQIAHNIEIGANTVMSAQVGVAGSTKIGEWCMFGGQVGVAGHINIGDKTLVGAQSGVSGGNVLKRGNVAIQGSPAIGAKNFYRSSVVYKKLPEMYRELNEMKAELEKLKNKISC